jgi:hypothetical protein
VLFDPATVAQIRPVTQNRSEPAGGGSALLPAASVSGFPVDLRSPRTDARPVRLPAGGPEDLRLGFRPRNQRPRALPFGLRFDPGRACWVRGPGIGLLKSARRASSGRSSVFFGTPNFFLKVFFEVAPKNRDPALQGLPWLGPVLVPVVAAVARRGPKGLGPVPAKAPPGPSAAILAELRRRLRHAGRKSAASPRGRRSVALRRSSSSPRNAPSCRPQSRVFAARAARRRALALAGKFP